MVGTQNASAAGPASSWGQPIFQADASHLEFYDERRRRFNLQMTTLTLIGIATLAGASVFGANLPAKVGSFLGVGGFLGTLMGPYGMFRTSYAEHRMFGIYENGLVPPVHYKGGWDPFLAWANIKAVKVLNFPLVASTALGRKERFVLRFEDNKGWPHRIRETDLVRLFGYSEKECLKIKEELLAVTRAKLPGFEIQMADTGSEAVGG